MATLYQVNILRETGILVEATRYTISDWAARFYLGDKLVVVVPIRDVDDIVATEVDQ